MTYRGVVIDGDHITGKRTMLAGVDATVQWVRFSGTAPLMRIHHVIGVAPPEILLDIWSMQDGMPGLPASEYDWSAIRDSSAGAIARMDALAQRWFEWRFGAALWPWETTAAMDGELRLQAEAQHRAVLYGEHGSMLIPAEAIAQLLRNTVYVVAGSRKIAEAEAYDRFGHPPHSADQLVGLPRSGGRREGSLPRAHRRPGPAPAGPGDAWRDAPMSSPLERRLRWAQHRRERRAWTQVVEQGAPLCVLDNITCWSQSPFGRLGYREFARRWREMDRRRQQAPWRRGTWA